MSNDSLHMMSASDARERLALTSLAMFALMNENDRREYTINVKTMKPGDQKISMSFDVDSGNFTVRVANIDETAFPESEQPVEQHGLDIPGLGQELDDDEDLPIDDRGAVMIDGIKKLIKMPKSSLVAQLAGALVSLSKLMAETNRLNMVIDAEDYARYGVNLELELDADEERILVRRRFS